MISTRVHSYDARVQSLSLVSEHFGLAAPTDVKSEPTGR